MSQSHSLTASIGLYLLTPHTLSALLSLVVLLLFVVVSFVRCIGCCCCVALRRCVVVSWCRGVAVSRCRGVAWLRCCVASFVVVSWCRGVVVSWCCNVVVTERYHQVAQSLLTLVVAVGRCCLLRACIANAHGAFLARQPRCSKFVGEAFATRCFVAGVSVALPVPHTRQVPACRGLVAAQS